MTARAQWRWWTWAAGIVCGFALVEHSAYTTGRHPTLHLARVPDIEPAGDL